MLNIFKKELVVGKDIKISDVKDFYFTISTSTNPPFFQRYRFSKSEDQLLFIHEKREGDHWPLREDDITIHGTIELEGADWEMFFSLIEGGTVVKRSDGGPSGKAGPYTYIYWRGDRGSYQEYGFNDYQKAQRFEDYCKSLMK